MKKVNKKGSSYPDINYDSAEEQVEGSGTDEDNAEGIAETDDSIVNIVDLRSFDDAKDNNETQIQLQEFQDDKTKDEKPEKQDDIDNFSNFSSLSYSTKLCPGGSMPVYVSVCPDTTTRIYDACVNGCAEMCEGQDQR